MWSGGGGQKGVDPGIATWELNRVRGHGIAGVEVPPDIRKETVNGAHGVEPLESFMDHTL